MPVPSPAPSHPGIDRALSRARPRVAQAPDMPWVAALWGTMLLIALRMLF